MPSNIAKINDIALADLTDVNDVAIADIYKVNDQYKTAWTAAAPINQSYGINWTGLSNRSINFNWTKGTGTNTNTLVLIQYNATTITDVPVLGTSYTANTDYGLGDAIGNSFVVYNDIYTAVSVTGLTPRKRYCFRLFAYNIDPVHGPIYNYSTAETYVIRYRNTLL